MLGHMDDQHFIKRTGNSKVFHLLFRQGGVLREWEDSTAEAEGWDGSWRSGSPKVAWALSTRIGDISTSFEVVGNSLVGTEQVDGKPVLVELAHVDGGHPVSWMQRLQGYGLPD